MASGNLAANAHFAHFTKRDFLRAFHQAGELAEITSRAADERPQFLARNGNDRADNTCSSQGGRGEGLQRRLSGWTRITRSMAIATPPLAVRPHRLLRAARPKRSSELCRPSNCSFMSLRQCPWPLPEAYRPARKCGGQSD